MVHNLFNALEDVAVDSFAGLGEYWQQFLQAGAREVHLAGSGPALFTLVKDKTQAEKIYHHLQQKGLCWLCKERIDNIKDTDTHRINEKLGYDDVNNVVLVHRSCHRQIQAKQT